MTNPAPASSRTVLPHMRVSWGGTIGVPAVEQWSNAVAFAPDLSTPGGDEAPSLAELDLMVVSMAAKIRTYFTGPNSYCGAAAKLTWAKTVWVLGNGKQRDTNTSRFDFPDGLFGPVATNPIWEQTYAITLRSDRIRGRGHAGRIYPPLSGGAPQGKTPYLDQGTVDAMSQGVTALLASLIASTAEVLNGGESGPRILFPGIVSAGDTQTGVAPLFTFITRVVTDRVADIQHRRTNQVPRAEGTTYPLYAGGEGKPGAGQNSGQVVAGP